MGYFCGSLNTFFPAASSKIIYVSIFNFCFLFKEAEDQSKRGVDGCEKRTEWITLSFSVAKDNFLLAVAAYFDW